MDFYELKYEMKTVSRKSSSTLVKSETLTSETSYSRTIQRKLDIYFIEWNFIVG